MLESLFDKVEGRQVLITPILKTFANGCLVHNMSLKTQNLDQGTTEIFISEFKNVKSLCSPMSEIYKDPDAKKQVLKDCLNYLK